MSALAEEIKKLLEEHHIIKKADSRLKELIPEITRVKNALLPLELSMQKEFQDIEALEKIGMKALFYKVLGSQEEQVEKERQEYLHASLKYDQVRKSLELLEFEYNILSKKTGSLSAIEQRLNQLSTEQEKEILNMPGAASLEIKKIYSQIESQQRLKIDISEANKAGIKSLECIDAVIAGLQQAHNWGQWDMSGKNPMSNHLKYTAIDKAKDWAYEANRQLKVFEKELLDVYHKIPEDFKSQLDSFNRFIDVFFDNLITDWIIQQKIYNALNNTLNIRDKVVRMLKTLETEVPKVDKVIEDLEIQKKEYVLSVQ
ncbi:MAG: hypothetical protein ABIR66_11995 [Saprospiraceae bacterium]